MLMTYTSDGKIIEIDCGLVFRLELNGCGVFEESGGLVFSVGGTAPRLLPEKGDKMILPIDEGYRFDITGEAPKLAENFYCRSNTMAMIMYERGGKYLALAPESGIGATVKLLRGDEGFTEAVISWKKESRLYIFAGELSEVAEKYRALRRSQGTLVTLEEKARRIAASGKALHGGDALRRLAASSIVWLWQDDYEDFMYSPEEKHIKIDGSENYLSAAKQLKCSGLEDIMWGIFFTSDRKAVKGLEELGYMTVEYDNYNDVPTRELVRMLPDGRSAECDYMRRRIGDYPEKITICRDGALGTAWSLEGLDGKRHQQYTMCPVCALNAMKREIPEIVRETPYTARFIDVFGGGLSECFSAEHPLTREESVKVKNDAFGFLLSEGLISGTEDGSEAVIPNLCYNEGMASPFCLRYDAQECGRRKARLYDDPEVLAEYESSMLDPEKRFPLWEMMYHDAVISFPYWGDMLLRFPTLWRKRMLFAALYGNPPLYSFFMKDFQRLLPAIAESMKRLSEVGRLTAFLPMTGYMKVGVGKDGGAVMRSEFGGKVYVTANFSDEDALVDGVTIPAADFVFGAID